MCGRFALALPPKSIAEHFQLDSIEGIETRYNIAPTQNAVTVDAAPGGEGRIVNVRRWGLIPGWAKDAKIGARLINARSETAAEKASFRTPLKKRRCLVPASGFYEWMRNGSVKQPYYIVLRDGGPLAFAGLWDRWDGGDAGTVESFTLLTTSANGIVGGIHDRMPVILKPGDYDRWLKSGSTPMEDIMPLLAPFPDKLMVMHPVGPTVNNARNEDPRCIERVA